jgi:Zn-dependent protease
MVSEDRSTNDASPDGAPKDASTDPPPTAPRWASGIPAGRIFGVPLVVSPAWVLLVLLALLVVPDTLRQHVNGLSKTGSFFGAVVLIALIYGAVLAHEASHVLVAKALDLRVGRVVLQLLGAQSEVLDDPQTPGRAYLVAAVGPLTSILLAGLGAAIGAQFEPNSIGWVLGWSFAWINGVVGAFNLLPGLPLDGGQMLRATLWHFTNDKLRALLVAGWVGRGVAAVVALVGLVAPGVVSTDRTVGAFYLLFIAFFMWSNASISIAQARVGVAVPTLNVSTFLRPALTVEA